MFQVLDDCGLDARVANHCERVARGSAVRVVIDRDIVHVIVSVSVRRTRTSPGYGSRPRRSQHHGHFDQTPTTVARAAPDWKPNRLMAAATASSKKLTPRSAQRVRRRSVSPRAGCSTGTPVPELKTTWTRIGTASSAMTRGWSRMASPWKANSRTRVSSSAEMDSGPSLRPRPGNARRRGAAAPCARAAR